VAARTARFAGAAREVGIAVGVVVFVHFTISRSNYAGVLYIRNMTTVLLALAWLLLIEDRVWASKRRRVVGSLAVGILLGLAVQGLLSTFAAGVLGLVGVATVWTRVEREERLTLGAIMSGSAILTLASAPIYYFARGDFAEFWSGWVEYSHYMSIGPGRSTAEQFSQGWTSFVGYYEHRPLVWALLLAYAVTVGAIWSNIDWRSRFLHLGLIGWWVAAWIELVLSQRFSAEYFVVTTVPTAFMGAALAGHVWKSLLATRVPARALVALPLIVAVLAVLFSSKTNFDDDVRAAWRFRGFNANAQHFADNRGGSERTALAVLDLVSHDNDALLAWTDDPWPYLNLKRVAATRFFYKRFLMGEIYLGRTSLDYVLPRTWEWFAEDMEEAKPVAFMRVNQPEVPDGNPFKEYVDRNFQLVLDDKDLPVWLRNDAAREVLEPSGTKDWEGRVPDVSPSGWKVNGSDASYEPGPAASADDQLTIAPDSCYRLDGVIPADAAGTVGQVAFHFADNAGKNERLTLSFEGENAVSSSDFVDFLTLPTDVPGDAREVPFSLVVGRRSAALVIENEVRAALLLPKSVTTTAESTTGNLELADLRLGSAPAGSGC
jgi:hypothetical protein